MQPKRKSPKSRSCPDIPKDDLLKEQYRVVVMGAAKVGKSSLISRFLRDTFSTKYTATVEDFHEVKYSIGGITVNLEIIDTTGAYAFPAMQRLSISTGDAFILVYSVDEMGSFEEVKNLRRQILDIKSSDRNGKGQTPIVVVGNKTDLTRPDPVLAATIDATVSIDWEHGYIEASAKDNVNTKDIFRELFLQIKAEFSPKEHQHMTSLPNVTSRSPRIKGLRPKLNLRSNDCVTS